MSTGPARAQRTRGGRQPDALSVDDLTAAALRVVERQGLDALTLKAVAEELGVTSPAVYHYVSGKDDLVRRVCERVADSVSLEVDESQDWRAQVIEVVIGMHRTFARYPGLGARALRLEGPAPAAGRIAGRVIELTVAAGYTRPQARRLNTALQLVFSGWLLQRAAFTPEGGPPARALPERALGEVLGFVLDGFATSADA